MFIVVNNTIKAREILIMIRILSIQAGNGIINMAIIRITLSNTLRSLADIIISPLGQTII
jgi:hypothetical protein